MKISIRKVSFYSAISLAPLIFLTAAKGGRDVDAPEQSPSVPSFAGNAQHTSIFQPPAQNLNRIIWSTDIDLHDSFGGAHYSPPLVTAANTVIIPVKTATDGFVVNAFDSSGAVLYTLTTDYVLPPHGWIPVYNPVVTTGSFGTRLYYPGRGGTIYHVDNPDSAAHGPVVQEVFYTTLANYQANAAAYNAAIFVNTPITADSSGNIFFGFRVQGTAPAPISSTQSGFARIDPNGVGTYVLTGTAAGIATINRDSHNSAPALSNDETTLYVVAKSNTNPFPAYLLGLNSMTLATKYKVLLKDPRDGGNASVTDDATSSPTVGPDGDVYFGLFGNPGDGSRGFLLHFSGDLATEKPPGGFGWDYTCAIVPASMVPSYQGTSSYLIFAKYNNYAFDDGNGVNRIALLDPNATQLDAHSSASGLVEMREVLTVNGPTPDPAALSTQFPYAVREWCINTAAVNPATNSIFTPSEDGYIYRWNVATNSLSQAVKLTQGIAEPYVPTVIGPGGVIYTLNGGTMFALGGLNGVGVVVTSSIPDVRTVVVGQSLTFTATVTNTGPSGLIPSGTVTFTDLTYQGTTPVTTTLGTVSLDGSGQAAITTSSLTAGGNFLGNHLITATYNGDSNFSTGSARLHQKVHANATTTTLTSTPNPSNAGQAVTFTATVAPVPAGSTKPSGMVTFQEGTTVLAQVPLNIQGSCSFSTSSLPGGSHSVTATYASDTAFASSNGATTQQVGPITPTPTPGVTPTATPGPTATPSGTPGPTATPSPTPGGPASQAVNLSTRMRVQTGDNVGIGGFIITGSGPKHVLIRAIGPSLSQFGVPDPLADPVLELHGTGAFVQINNDNWQDDPAQKALIEATGLQPTNDFEAAIDATLNPGSYTAVVSGKNNTAGIGLVEVYDVDPSATSKLGNISTRAFVSTGDSLVIAGFILGNQNGFDRVILRGIGPSLVGSGVANPLANPMLELRDSNGALLRANNDWQDDPAQAAELTNAGLAPTNNLESGIAATLPPGLYTALLAGVNNGTGIGLVEVYDRGP